MVSVGYISHHDDDFGRLTVCDDWREVVLEDVLPVGKGHGYFDALRARGVVVTLEDSFDSGPQFAGRLVIGEKLPRECLE